MPDDHAVTSAVPTTHPFRNPWSRPLEASVLFFVLVALSARLVLNAWRRGILDTVDSPLLYQAATVGFSYLEFGFLRRGLGGTLVHLLGNDLLRATALFHLASAACVAALAAWLSTRLDLGWRGRLLFALVAAALMARWAEDAGRIDLAVAACMALATVAVARQRPAWAALPVSVGLLFHETAFIFGVPLLAALAWRAHATWARPGRTFAIAALTLSAAFGLYVLSSGISPDIATALVTSVQAKLPRHEQVDWALYFVVGGGRGVQTSLCQNGIEPNHLLHVASGLALIALAIALLTPRRRTSVLVAVAASVVPFLFLCVVANDTTRWMVLSVFNVWLVSGLEPPVAAGRPVGAGRIITALLLVPLIHPKVVRIDGPIYAPLPIVDRISLALGGPKSVPFADVLVRCDPDWRSVLATGPSGRTDPRTDR